MRADYVTLPAKSVTPSGESVTLRREPVTCPQAKCHPSAAGRVTLIDAMCHPFRPDLSPMFGAALSSSGCTALRRSRATSRIVRACDTATSHNLANSGARARSA